MVRRPVTEAAQERAGSKRLSLAWLARAAFTVLLLSLLFAKIDVKGVFATLRDIDIALWCLSVILYFSFRGILSCQMSLGLAPLDMDVTVRQLLRITLIASFYALILPGTLLAGSAASWYKLSRSEHKPVEAAALVIYFRIVNTITLLGIGLVAVWLDAWSWTKGLRLPALGMFLACLLLLLPFVSRPVARFAVGATDPFLRSCRLPRLLHSKAREVRNAVFSFQTLGASQVLFIFALSMLANAVAVFVWYLLAEAVGIQLPLLAIIWISSFLWIIQMIPISIGGLGLREVSLVALLHEYGIAEAQAVSFSLAIFSLMVVSGLVGGLLESWDFLLSRRGTEGAVADRTVDKETDT